MGMSLLGPATTVLMVSQGFEFGLRKIAQLFFYLNFYDRHDKAKGLI